MAQQEGTGSVDDTWLPEYDRLVHELLARYFGSPPNLAAVYPTRRKGYPWSDHRPRVVDSRIPAKNNEEYHGLERHAWQYHVTVQYEEAWHFFPMAAAMRREDAEFVMEGCDAGHSDAVRFCLRHALFNRALATRPRAAWPTLAEFGIDPAQHPRRVRRTWEQLDAFGSPGG
ncbi:hypothetical protein [Streptomyces antimycoticus]|uniref:hypothetical protein n=1 Tax=Streptomyces antimycoticus TaxID=68175 RepID=UPI000A381656|nr:hypothetical protein [Streptomyces antimycoticus]